MDLRCRRVKLKNPNGWESVCWEIRVDCPPSAAFNAIQRIGGKTGWYYANWLWRLRGLLDRLVGGVGLDRGRSDPVKLQNGDKVDFWRVELIVPDQVLLLAAEMKLPGSAWLRFDVERDQSGSLIRQTALFEPAGLWGLAYWYSLYPVHQFLFSGMLRNIARTASCNL